MTDSSQQARQISQIIQDEMAHGGYVPWGSAALGFDAMSLGVGSSSAQAAQLTRLASSLALIRLLEGAFREGLSQSERSLHSHGGIMEELRLRDVLFVLWHDLPCLLNASDRDRLEEIFNRVSGEELSVQSLAHVRSLGLDAMRGHGVRGSLSSLALEAAWEAVFKHIPQDLVASMLSTSRNFLSRCVESARQEGIVLPVLANLDFLVGHCRIEGVSQSQKEAVAWLAMVSDHFSGGKAPPPMIGVIRPMVDMVRWDVALCDFEHLLGLDPGSLSKAMDKQGWFGQLGLSCHIPNAEKWFSGDIALFGDKTQKAILGFHADPKKLLEGVGISCENLDLAQDALDLAAFSHLGKDVDNLLRMMRAKDHPMRALVVGVGTCGKTALVRACAKQANVGILKLDEYAAVQCDLAWVSHYLSSLSRRARLCGDAAMVVDPADRMLSGDASSNALLSFLSSTDGKPVVPEVWVVSGMEKVSPDIVRSFDLVVRVGNMPMAQRQAFAETYFDKETAKQVAQSCPTIGEIISLVKWKQATGQSDWQDLASRLAGLQQACFASKEAAGDLPVAIYPPRPGHPGFEDVVGQDNTVRQARRIVAGLRNPLHYKKLGAKPPKGVLLIGPPGCGKTHLARAMAGEAGVPLLLADAAAMARTPELISAVFAEARRQAPCLLFLDELDAVGTTAKGAMGGSPDPARQSILNRLLTELDGFEGLDGVMVVGATHRADLLDEALVRSGRLGVHIQLERLTRASREQLWRHYTKGSPCADTIHWERLARISTGMSPADIAQAANLAALRAADDGVDCIGYKHLVDAVDEVSWGVEASDLPMLAEERLRTAVHEAGHALLAWRNGREIERVSVRARSNALGYVSTIPEEGRYGHTPVELVSEIAMIFGGLAAETIVYGEHSTGVATDLEMARSLARKAVRVAGMSPLFPAGVDSPPFGSPSDKTLLLAERIENRMLRQMRSKAHQWLEKHKQVLLDMANHLVEVMELDGVEAHAWIDERLPESEKLSFSGVGDIRQAARAWPSLGALGPGRGEC